MNPVAWFVTAPLDIGESPLIGFVERETADLAHSL